ncbi:Transmembrane protein 248 [Nymphon striatum]|nr:Transmembrane protein 248 [Nymphon striatum]
MATFTPIQNLKSFLINGPPSVIFTLCLSLFAVAAFTFACYVGGNVFITDPMTITDWNMFFDNLADNEFCVLNNNESKNHVAPILSQLQNQSSHQDVLVSVSAVFSLYWSPTQTFNVSTILGQMMHLNKQIIGNNSITVGIHFIGEKNFSSCSAESNICHTNQGACVTFYGPKNFFPQTRMPPSCTATYNSLNISSEVFTSRPLVSFSSEVKNSTSFPISSWCSHGTSLRMKYQSNSDISVMLSMHERSIINLHLMYTFYFFIVMVITIFCCASCRGRGKTSDLKKVNFEKVIIITDVH